MEVNDWFITYTLINVLIPISDTCQKDGKVCKTGQVSGAHLFGTLIVWVPDIQLHFKILTVRIKCRKGL